MVKTACLLFSAFLISSSASAEPFHHPFGEWREYNRDWLAACPDRIIEGSGSYYGHSCFASAGSAELNSAGQPAYKLTLVLNRLTGRLDLALAVQTDGAEVDTGRPLYVRFAGEAEEGYAFGTDLQARYDTANQFFFADPAASDALIEKMKERSSVTLRVPLKGRPAFREVTLSLQGVIASIDFMNAYSRRVSQY